MGRLEPGLISLIRRNAYARQPNPKRRKAEKTKYKKGWEVRIVLDNEDEIESAYRLLERSEVIAGKPFLKHRRWVLPLYGRTVVERITASVSLRKKSPQKKQRSAH